MVLEANTITQYKPATSRFAATTIATMTPLPTTATAHIVSPVQNVTQKLAKLTLATPHAPQKQPVLCAVHITSTQTITNMKATTVSAAEQSKHHNS